MPADPITAANAVIAATGFRTGLEPLVGHLGVLDERMKAVKDALDGSVNDVVLTAVNDALRANMLQGASWRSVGGELAIITMWLVLCFSLALRLFRWR